jgi:hypothetical protein
MRTMVGRTASPILWVIAAHAPGKFFLRWFFASVITGVWIVSEGILRGLPDFCSLSASTITGSGRGSVVDFGSNRIVDWIGSYLELYQWYFFVDILYASLSASGALHDDGRVFIPVVAALAFSVAGSMCLNDEILRVQKTWLDRSA